MNYYTTELEAIEPISGELRTFCGPHIPAISWSKAEEFCQERGFGYLRVTGQLIAELGTKVDEDGFVVPDWDNRKDYDQWLN